MPELNFNLLNPSAELYSGPQVKLDPQAAYDTAQAQQQSNMLSQLYAKHYDPQTGGINYNSLIGEAAQNPLTARAMPKIMEGAQSQAQSMAEIEQKKAAAAKSESEVFKSNVDNAMKWSRSQLDNIKTPEEYLKWHEANHTNPYLAEFFRQNNISKEDRRSEINSLLSQEGGLQKLIDMSRQGLDNYLGAKPAETKQFQPTAAEAEYALYQKDPRAYAAFKQAQKGETGTGVGAGATAAGTTGVNAPTGKPLNQAQKEERADFSARIDSAHKSTVALESLVDELIGNPNAINDKGNLTPTSEHPGLPGITNASGMIDVYAPKITVGGYEITSGNARAAKQILETIKGKVKSLGREVQSQSGKLGNMAVQEWEYVANAIQTIDPAAPNFKDQLRNVVQAAKDVEDTLRNKYKNTYDEDSPVSINNIPFNWTLQMDSKGNKAWVSPDRKQHIEVKK